MKMKKFVLQNNKFRNIASMVKLICQDYGYFNQINYINISIYDSSQRHFAPIASMVKHQSNKLNLPRYLGSNPGRSDSENSFILNKGGILR